ncbi:MAG: DUF1573 domain-containing protein [Cyclobacteriaceae bacterium]
MKKLVVFLLSLMITAGAYAQGENEKSAPQPQPGPYIAFVEKSHDFGDIEQGDIVKYTFEFENSGDAPLILSNVQTTCGCTTSYWPRDPIAPGEKSKIEAQFNSRGKHGRQNKIITVTSNATNNPERVSIISNVLPKSAESESQ